MTNWKKPWISSNINWFWLYQGILSTRQNQQFLPPLSHRTNILHMLGKVSPIFQGDQVEHWLQCVERYFHLNFILDSDRLMYIMLEIQSGAMLQFLILGPPLLVSPQFATRRLGSYLPCRIWMPNGTSTTLATRAIGTHLSPKPQAGDPNRDGDDRLVGTCPNYEHFS